MRKRLDVRLPEDLDYRLRMAAAEADRSITWVVEQALEAALGATGVASESRPGESRANDSDRVAAAPGPVSPRAPEPPTPQPGAELVSAASRLAAVKGRTREHLPTCRCPVCKPPREKR